MESQQLPPSVPGRRMLASEAAAVGRALKAAKGDNADEEHVVTSALAKLPPLTEVPLKTSEMDPEAVEAEQKQLAALFTESTAAVSSSALTTLLRGVANNDSSCTSLELASSPELRHWPPPRIASGLRLLRRNTCVIRVDLSSAALNDEVAPALAEVLSTNTTLTWLSVAHNDFREPGLLEIVGALLAVDFGSRSCCCCAYQRPVGVGSAQVRSDATRRCTSCGWRRRGRVTAR